MTELRILKSFKSELYLNHEDIGYDLLKNQDFRTDISTFYFNNLLNKKNEVLDITDY